MGGALKSSKDSERDREKDNEMLMYFLLLLKRKYFKNLKTIFESL